MSERRSQAERRAESRERLLRAAVIVLAERGYAHASLVEIGRKAGLSRGLVSHHFGSKESCMQEVVHYISQAMNKQIEGLDVVKPGIDNLLDTYFDGIRKKSPYAKAMYVIIIEAVTGTPGLQGPVAEAFVAGRKFIAQRLAEWADKPVDSPAVEVAATITLGILRGVALQWMADPNAVNLEELTQTAKTMIQAAVAASSGITPVAD